MSTIALEGLGAVEQPSNAQNDGNVAVVVAERF